MLLPPQPTPVPEFEARFDALYKIVIIILIGVVVLLIDLILRRIPISNLFRRIRSQDVSELQPLRTSVETD